MNLLFLALCLAQSTAEPPIGDLTGYYACTGKDPGGKIYEGIVTIVRKGEVYAVTWAFSGQAITGVGIRVGETLAVGWAIPSDAGLVRGVNRYAIHGRNMTGRWASLPGSGRVGDERLEWLRERKEPEEGP